MCWDAEGTQGLPLGGTFCLCNHMGRRGSGTHGHRPGLDPTPQLSWGSSSHPGQLRREFCIVSTQLQPFCNLDLQEQCPSGDFRASNSTKWDRICRASDSEKYQELQVTDLRTQTEHTGALLSVGVLWAWIHGPTPFLCLGAFWLTLAFLQTLEPQNSPWPCSKDQLLSHWFSQS